MTQTAPRVQLLDRSTAPLIVRGRFSGGDPGPITASLALVPELAQVALPFIGRALAGVTVEPRTAELVIVRASALLGCTYCTLTHGAVALGAGVSAGEVRALCDRDGLTRFTDEREAALLAWVDSMAADHGEVPDEVADAMAAHHDDATIVELATMVGCTILLNRYCTGLRLPTGADTLRTLADAGLDDLEVAS